MTSSDFASGFQDRDSGEMRPGKDGLAFRAELVDELIGALQAAQDWGAA